MKAPERTHYSITASPGSALPVAVRGEGCWIEDADGHRGLDACGGAMGDAARPCHPRGRRGAPRTASGTRSRIASTSKTTRCSTSPSGSRGSKEGAGGLFDSSGGEATSRRSSSRGALTRSFRAGPARSSSLSRVTSYQRLGIGALSLSGSRWRAPLELLLRKPVGAEQQTRASAEEGAAALEAAILSRGADHVAGVDPVGRDPCQARRCRCPTATSRPCAEVCNRHEILLVADKVETAFGAPDAGPRCEHSDALPEGPRSERASAAASVQLSGMVSLAPAGCGR